MTGSRKVLLVAVAMLLFVAPAAFADSLVAVDGTYAFGNNGYGIPPYGGTLNGHAAEFYCVDFRHDIKGGDSWKAVVTDLSTNPASFGSTYLNDKNTYLKFTWLVTQMIGSSDQTAKAADQWAIWSLTGGIDPFTGQYSAQTLLQNADSAVIGGFTGQGWDILTPDVGQYGQEFLIQTPEPSGLLLLAVGLCGVFLFSYRERLVRPGSRDHN